VLIGAALAVVTNYATVQVPDFFTDQARVWLLLGVLVIAAVVVELIVLWPREADQVQPIRSSPAIAPASLRRPTVDVGVLRGRDVELKRVTRLVSKPGGKFAVVCGAGGMGKTTFAGIVAEHAEQRGNAVFWIRWRDEESLAAQMIEVAVSLGLSTAAVSAAQTSGASMPDLVWRHLSSAGRWVLVLDNIDRPSAVSIEGEPVAAYRGWVRPGGAGLLHPRSGARRRAPGHAAHPRQSRLAWARARP